MTEGLKRSLGTKVRAARKRAGLTQEALAARIGKTPESVSNIERGQQTPSIETLGDLARELALPITEFFADDDTAIPLPTDARLRAEARLRELLRNLDDGALEVVVEQVAALARYVTAN
jgi:transcriptional regulator with XRE-family HTH domain